jgi:hypothetical protein
MAGRRIALLVSTSTYDDPTFRQLKSPAADIAALSGILQDPGIGGYEVQLLSDAPSYKVNQAVDRLFADARRDDLILLYFSGHGFRDDGNRLFMVMRDSLMMQGESQSTLLASTAVSAQFVRDQLERCRSRRKIIILDCCYAGAFPAGATKDAGKIDVMSEFGGRGSVVITASSALQYSFESDGDEAISEISGNAKPSVFTGALIEGIVSGSADLNGDGVIDIDELYSHVHDQVTLRVPRQTPQKKSDVEGTLFVAQSPRGPRPIKLQPEILHALRSPLPLVRLAMIKTLIDSCSTAHLGVVLAVRDALREHTEDDSISVTKAARAALVQIGELTGDVTLLDADAVATHPGVGPEDARDITIAAQQEADAIVATAQREADERISEVEREAAKLRAIADQEVAENRAATERDIAKLRTINEREIAQFRATAKRERDEILVTAKRQADEMRWQAQRILEESEALISEDTVKQTRYEILVTAKRQADEMRSQAQRILEESEAARAQAEAEFEIQLTTRREEAERQEAERLAAAQAATQRLVSEAEQRASTAEQRAAKASAQADQTRRDADSHSRQLVANAKKYADQIVSQAKSQAEQMLAEVKADAERRLAAAQHEFDELIRQKDSIASHLKLVRQLLSGQALQLPTTEPRTKEALEALNSALNSGSEDDMHSKDMRPAADWRAK